MRALYLLRHSLTEGNERRLYYGWTDLPLSPAGRALAREASRELSLPPCDLYAASSLSRTSQTLRLLAGREPDLCLDDLREMNFGAFEMRGYESLKNDPDYRRWVEDAEGAVRCPGGESRREFLGRVTRGGETLLAMDWQSALAVVHGGVAAGLMARWFPNKPLGYYQWLPEPCGGYLVTFDGPTPIGFIDIREAIQK